MLDIQFIRDNAELVQEKSKQKGTMVEVFKLLELDEKRRHLIGQTDELRQKRNELSSQNKGERPTDQQIAEGREVKEKIIAAESELTEVDTSYFELLETIPNVFPDDTPLGGEEANREEKKWGETLTRNFPVQDHLDWGEKHGLIDFKAGAKVAGNKFYYLKGSLVQLELAVFQLGLQLVQRHGLVPMSVPHMVNTKTVKGTGFLPKGEEDQIYKIENEDLNLIATAEIPITGYHADDILNEKDLPILYAGLSPAYRKEAGAYGKHSRGLYRVHQFNKLEMYVFCKPDQSEEYHQKLLNIEEEFCRELEIPYRIIRIAAGDMGGPAYKKYDIEYWSPIDGNYRELMSCSNVTDYQARRLNIRYRDEQGKTHLVHTLNGTAAAYSRVCIALIENHQDAQGNVHIPVALQPFMGGKDNIL